MPVMGQVLELVGADAAQAGMTSPTQVRLSKICFSWRTWKIRAHNNYSYLHWQRPDFDM